MNALHNNLSPQTDFFAFWKKRLWLFVSLFSLGFGLFVGIFRESFAAFDAVLQATIVMFYAAVCAYGLYQGMKE